MKSTYAVYIKNGLIYSLDISKVATVQAFLSVPAGAVMVQATNRVTAVQECKFMLKETASNGGSSEAGQLIAA